MKKNLAILLILVLLISCGKKGNNKDKGFDLKNSGGTNQKVDEIEKYNSYIGVYNKLVSFEKTANSYFKEAGIEAQFKKPEGSINANFYDVKNWKRQYQQNPKCENSIRFQKIYLGYSKS